MTYNATQLQLTHVLQRLYRRVGGKVLFATGGSTSTVIDTKLIDDLAESNEDDIYNGGTIIVIDDAGGANAAPEGEFSRITDYDAINATATFSPVLTTAIASGDRVIIAPVDFPLYDMIEVVNDALKSLGDIPSMDTSITTVAGQYEYTLPLALKGRELLKVEMIGNGDQKYSEVPSWRITPAAGGSTGTILFPSLSDGFSIRITSAGKHPRVEAFDDFINEYIHPEVVHAVVYAHALQWKNDSSLISGGADQALLSLEQKAWSQLDRAKYEHKIEIPPKRVQGFPSWGNPL